MAKRLDASTKYEAIEIFGKTLHHDLGVAVKMICFL